MFKTAKARAAIAVAALAAFSTGALPTSALAQASGNQQQYRDAYDRDGHRQQYADQTRGRDDAGHCGSGNGAVGTIVGGAGGAVLGRVLGGGTLGTVAGGVGGALIGRTLDKKNTRDHNRDRNGC